MTDSISIAETGQQVLDAVRSVVVGMDDPLEIALATILAGGHVLFEDVPGLGKTLAARSLASAMGLPFRRLQCTPDLLPADITGSYVYAPTSGDFVFRPGPVFTGLLSVLFLVLTPVTNSIVRVAEAEADAFGLDAAREPDGFASVSMKLSEYRKIEPTKWEEILFYDHPSGRTRVQMAMDWKARHLKELPADQQRMFVMTADQPAK